MSLEKKKNEAAEKVKSCPLTSGPCEDCRWFYHGRNGLQCIVFYLNDHLTDLTMRPGS